MNDQEFEKFLVDSAMAAKVNLGVIKKWRHILVNKSVLTEEQTFLYEEMLEPLNHILDELDEEIESNTWWHE